MTPAVDALRKANVEFALHRYDVTGSATYGHAAARALGLEQARVFKTLVVEVDARKLAVALVPVSAELSFKRLATAAGAKRVAMAAAARAERSTGYVLGGISPFGQKRPLTTSCHDTALEFASIYVSGGMRGLEIEVDPTDLIAVCGATAAAIARH